MFIGWMERINRKLKTQILVGTSAICWAIWLTRNDIVLTRSQHHIICRLSFGGPTGPGLGPYYRRRIARRWRWDAGLLRQPRWRCLQDTVGNLVIELLFRYWVCKPFFYSFWIKTLCLRLRGQQCLCYNKEQLYALVDAEAMILIYIPFSIKKVQSKQGP